MNLSTYKVTFQPMSLFKDSLNQVLPTGLGGQNRFYLGKMPTPICYQRNQKVTKSSKNCRPAVMIRVIHL